MGKVKHIITFSVAVTILSALLHYVGKSHIDFPLVGSFAAYKETSNYYKQENKELATIENIKECMKYMNNLYKRLKGTKSKEAVKILDEGVEFFKSKGAYVAVEKLAKLRDEIER